MAGRKKLFKTYLTEHISFSTREDGIKIINFINLEEKNIPKFDDINNFVLCAEDISKKYYRNYYKIIGFEIINEKEIFHAMGLEHNYRSFYKESIVKIPEELIDRDLISKFLNHKIQWKKYKKRKD